MGIENLDTKIAQTAHNSLSICEQQDNTTKKTTTTTARIIATANKSYSL